MSVATLSTAPVRLFVSLIGTSFVDKHSILGSIFPGWRGSVFG
jgi:hypothetical protein